MHETNNYPAIQPVAENFRDLPLEDAFAWEKGRIDTGPDGLYVVAFSSVRHPASTPEDTDLLLAHDHEAFIEARALPGFRTYWHDELPSGGKRLSFCLWDTKEAARYAASQPKHRAAVNFALESGLTIYAQYDVTGHDIITTDRRLEFGPAQLLGHFAVAADEQ